VAKLPTSFIYISSIWYPRKSWFSSADAAVILDALFNHRKNDEVPMANLVERLNELSKVVGYVF
jgi:hypothetical protein